MRGWIGHNGSLPGFESLTVYMPSAQAALAVLLNTDIDHKGEEPSTLFGEAITTIICPAQTDRHNRRPGEARSVQRDTPCMAAGCERPDGEDKLAHPEHDESTPDEAEAALRRARFGALPERIRPQDRVEELPATLPDPARDTHHPDDWIARYGL